MHSSRFFSPDIKKTIQVIVRGQTQTHRLYASIIARRRSMLGLQKPKGAEYPLHDDLFNNHSDGYIKCITYSKYASTTEEHYFDPKILIPTEGDCILDNFLYEQKKRFDEGDSSCWNVRDEQMHYLLADMFGAGLDTTSVTLAWFLLYMALYPDEQVKCFSTMQYISTSCSLIISCGNLLFEPIRISNWFFIKMQECVRNEILTSCPNEDNMDGSKLPVLMATICEVQRIRSIVPVGIPHGCLQVRFAEINHK